MSPKPEVHFWASGMPRQEAQLYLLDMCGSDSSSYSESAKEVTCERCLAMLRGDTVVTAPARDEVREAVQRERAEIVEFLQATSALSMHPDIKIVLRQAINTIRNRP